MRQHLSLSVSLLVEILLTLCSRLLDWIVDLDSVFQIGKCPTEGTEKSRVIGDEHWADTFVMVHMRARRNKERLEGGDAEETDTAIGRVGSICCRQVADDL